MLSKSDFELEKDPNVWVPRTGTQSIPYSDFHEGALLEKVLRCEDRSVYSEEFLPYLSWSQEYHLSPIRGNILAPLEHILKPGCRVLELGAGCGAITRAMGERGCLVDAVEGTLQRASIAAARCADLSSVKLFCADIGNIDFGENSYDVVTLIGVLEYSAVYAKTADPFAATLSVASRHLHDRGCLLLAIENQLGLKYFNGMKEDHVGISFFGIQGFYQMRRRTAETFTRRALTALVQNAGLEHVAMYYPFPDYKTPSAVFSDAAFQDGRLNIHQIVNEYRSRDYSAAHTPIFHEASVYRALQSGGVAPDFANSFLMVGSRQSVHAPDWLVRIFSSQRKSQYRVDTSIGNYNGELRVTKRRLSPDTFGNSRVVDFVPPLEAKFHEGELLSFEMERALFLGSQDCWPEFERLVREWIVFLKGHADAGGTLDGSWYDAIPSNLIRTNGRLNYFDAEWRIKERIPLVLPVIRGLVSTLGRVSDEIWLSKLPFSSLKALSQKVLVEYQISLSEDDVRKSLDLDAQVHEDVNVQVGREQYRRLISAALVRNWSLVRIYRNLRAVFREIRRFVRRPLG